MKFSVIILVGGKSSRMGEEKYAVEFMDHQLIDYPLALAKKLMADEVLVIGNDQQSLSGSFRYLIDEMKEVGPLGGIYTGLKNSSNEVNVVIPCDAPFLNPELIEVLLSFANDYHVVVPSNKGRLQPASGVYSKSLIEQLELFLSSGKRKLMDFAEGQNLKIVSEELLKDKVNERTFVNLNSKSDIEEYGG